MKYHAQYTATEETVSSCLSPNIRHGIHTIAILTFPGLLSSPLSYEEHMFEYYVTLG